MKWLILFLLFGLANNAFSQGRSIDLSVTITDPAPGDSFVSPSKKTVTVYLKNNGPDTIIPKDEYYVKFIFSAFHLFPKFSSFQTYVYPGDSFKYQQEIDVNYVGDVASMNFCAEAFAYSKGRDSIRTETGAGTKNNKHCVTTRHIDSAKNSSTEQFIKIKTNIYPNPSLGPINVTSIDPIQFIQVADLNGRIVTTVLPQSKLQVLVDLKDEVPGMYLITITTTEGAYAKKVLLSR